MNNYSFEFFPPRNSAGAEKLGRVIERLGERKPEYFSVTFGAGGSTQEGTVETVQQVIDAGFMAAPHLSCIGTSKEQIRAILHLYRDKGINRLVALRGDMPSGSHFHGDFRYANELVEFIRAETGDAFQIDVAAYPEMHPQAPSPQADLTNFARKAKAGADAAITQYFYNADAYFYFVEACRQSGVEIPIVPGIMPITNYSQLARFSDTCGAEIPRWIRLRLKNYGDDISSIRSFGMEVTTNLCRRLLDGGAPGLHIYTLNKSKPALTLLDNLGL